MRRKRLLGTLLGLSLLAGACGGDDSGGDEAKVDSSVKEGVQSQLGGSATTAGGATATTVAAKNIGELQAQWDAERAKVVAGKATVTFRSNRVGVHRLKAAYTGSGVAEASTSQQVTVRVKRR